MINKFTDKVTIYNDIPSDGVNPRRFERFVISDCLVYNEISEGANGTLQKIINAQYIITRDTKHYKSPLEYNRLAEDERQHYYTAQIDDFVVLSEVDDVVTTSKEFQELQKKYKDGGFAVTSASEDGKPGMSTYNIRVVHA